MTKTSDYLETYLQDHRAGAEFGSDLARRLAGENPGTPHEDFLLGLAQEIEQDVGVLAEIMDRLGISKPILKTAGAEIGEKLSRLKPNDQLTGYSPLSRVLEIEGLRTGVQGKLSMWQALREVASDYEQLDESELDELVGSAETQLEGLREQHRIAVREAF